MSLTFYMGSSALTQRVVAEEALLVQVVPGGVNLVAEVEPVLIVLVRDLEALAHRVQEVQAEAVRERVHLDEGGRK